MLNKIHYFFTQIKEGRLKAMWKQTAWIYSYAKKYWLAILFYTLLGLSGTFLSIGTGLLSKDLLDMIIARDTVGLVRTFASFIGISAVNILTGQLSAFASNWLSIRVNNEIKADIFDKILATDWEYVSQYHTGDLLTRWNGDSSVISSGILNWLPNLVIYSFRFLGILAMIIYYDPTFALFAMLGLPMSILMSRTMLGKMKRNNQRSAALGGKMSGFNQETISNIQTIKAFDLMVPYGKKLRSLQKEYLTMRIDFQKLTAITSAIMAFVGIIVSYSCYGWGIYRVWSGAITVGTMQMFLGFTGNLSSALNSLINLIPTAISITTSAGRLINILELPKEDDSDKELVNGYIQKHTYGGIGLKLHDMSYAYQNGTEVFSHASMSASPHEIVALVGPSGEGKTTMLRILLSLVHPQFGECYLTGGTKGYDTFPLSPSTRKLFSYVPQGNTMFSGTIAENMQNVKEEVTDEEIIEALKAACAWEFVEKLPEGIHSVVKERGGGFSEGQAQRLSIARSLLRRSPILLLDEATSALDVATERKLLKNIMQDTYPRTCIITTHRPTVLSICHKVYAIRNKRCDLLSAEEILQMEQDF
jgi:ABC-type bacteriocin/lantibiotic exporter with double-glycine peptidase domain